MTPHASEPSVSTTKSISPYAAALPLRQFLGRHNRQALILSGIALVSSILLWAAVCGFTYWFSLVAFTVSKSFNVQSLGSQANDVRWVNYYFSWGFPAAAVVYLLSALVVRRYYRADKLRESGLYFFWVLIELYMAVANVTFAVWGNLRAIVRLGKVEVAEAWRLLQRMNEQEGRLSLGSLRLEIDDEQVLCRVMFALQLIGLVGMRENAQGWYLYLQGQEIRNLLNRQG